MGRKFSLQRTWSVVLLVVSGAVAAAEKPVSVEQLQKALSKYQAIERLDVDFKQIKTLKDIALDLKSEGHLTLKMPTEVEWKILKPQPMTVTLANQKITIKSASNTQTFSQEQNPSAKDRQSFQTMLTWLKLDAKAIAEKYAVSEIGQRQYKFVSKDPNEPVVKAMTMKMDESGHVANLLFEEVSGDSMRLNFAKPKVVYKK